MNSTGTIGDAVRLITHHLEQAGIDEANSEARLIIGYALGLTRSEIINRNDEKLSEDQITRRRSFAQTPTSPGKQIITMTAKKNSRASFKVSPKSLIPARIQKRLWMRSWIMHAKREHPSDCLTSIRLYGFAL